MDAIKSKYPDIYLLSKFPGLEAALRTFLPTDCNLIVVPAAAPLTNWNEGIPLSKEEKDFFKNAEVLICDCTYLKNIIYELPSVKWVQTTWAGIDMLMEDFDKTKPLPNYITTRYSDPYFGELMSNYVIAQIVNIERGFYTYCDMQKVSKWSRPFFPNFRVLSDLKIGVLGAGTLGGSVGNLLTKAGCSVLMYVKTKRSKSECTTTELNDILQQCDYICNVLPSTEETRGLLDGNVLKQCCKKPVFINIGRSDVIQASTIIHALKEGWISKAVLDVFDAEPLPSDSPLWTTDKVYITPHVGAIPRIDGIAKFIVQNYLRYSNKEPLLNVIDWEKGY